MDIGVAKVRKILVSNTVSIWQSRKNYTSRFSVFALILARHLSIWLSRVSTAGGIIPLSPSLFRTSWDKVVSTQRCQTNNQLKIKSGESIPIRAAWSWRIEDDWVVEEIVEEVFCGVSPLIFCWAASEDAHFWLPLVKCVWMLLRWFSATEVEDWSKTGSLVRPILEFLLRIDGSVGVTLVVIGLFVLAANRRLREWMCFGL